MTTTLDDLITDALAVAPDDEMVTRALGRDVELAHGAGTMVLITLDNGHDHTKPNTLGARGLASLNAAIDAALARDDAAVVGITGKPFWLAAGADLTAAAALADRDQAKLIAQIGHGVFRKLGDTDKPTFCFVNGAALGGGLELALHCDYRTVQSSVGAIALPEVFLGMVPGWGGAYLLPNLVGADRALTVLLDNALEQNRMLKAPQAHRLGIADAMFGGADFLEQSLDWAARVVVGELTVQRAEVDRGTAWEAAVDARRSVVDARLHGAAPAPYRALDLVSAARTSDRETGFAAEDEALADLLMSPELKSGLYAFDLVQRRAKRPAGAPDRSLARPVTKLGVVGAGLMATQLVTLFVRRLEVPVVLTDLDQQRVDAGVAGVHAEIDRLHELGRLDGDRANRYRALVSGSTALDAFADADFVIEAVFEELAVKQQVFAQVEAVVSQRAVLATNTSSLSVSAMAEGLRHPERVVGFHFFNPVAVLPLVEVARGERTNDATVATALSVGRTLKKSCVLVKDAPAFVVNRLLTRLLGPVTQAVDDGTDPAIADHALDELGLPMSPLALLQLVGPAIALHVAETLHDAYGDRFHVSANLEAMVAVGDSPWTGEQIREAALAGLADEITRMLEEGVVAAAADIDLCMILGAGWPFHLGGITPYLARTGHLRS